MAKLRFYLKLSWEIRQTESAKNPQKVALITNIKK